MDPSAANSSKSESGGPATASIGRGSGQVASPRTSPGRPSQTEASPNPAPAGLPPIDRLRTNAPSSTTAAIQSQDAALGVAQGTAVLLPARQAPDLRIYSASDAGVEPPRLRSAELPELLIAGFEKRTNNVELVISERGEVQHARMIGPPQRMPDIMVLSRAKELLFDPAIRNGVPVRYRLILSWNVTP
jgi:hypothetical protein